MPTEDENINFLYLVLTNSGPPTLDIPTISSALGLNNGATSKRWSRLRSAMEEGKNPGSTAYQFLWLAVKHSDREGKSLDWKDIAAKCNTTPGAAAKRYSRMKKAFEEGKDAPGSVGGTPVKAKGMPSKGKTTPSKATPSKVKATPSKTTPSKTTPSKTTPNPATAIETPKRKRANAPSKKEEEEEEEQSGKKMKMKTKTKTKTKTTAKMLEDEESESEEGEGVEYTPTKKSKPTPTTLANPSSPSPALNTTTTTSSSSSVPISSTEAATAQESEYCCQACECQVRVLESELANLLDL